jgi:tRNA nucleotidyltransferase (CCA-adding enzyme)
MPAAAPVALRRATFPEAVLDVLRRLADAGHRSWLVGGCVRDVLLRRVRAAADFDLATPATPEQVMAIFPRVIPTGVAHGTVTVLAGKEKVEVTTFRGEGAYVDGRRPESVTFLTDLEEDLARRDFTMNAMAYDPLGREFRDPWRGREDLRRRRIRAVGTAADRFAEDGLRPMRAVRFAAQLGYALEPSTHAAIAPALPVVRKVAVERISEELGKLLVAPHADRGLQLLAGTGLLEVVLPAVASLGPRAVAHAIQVVRRVPPDLTVRLAALLHGVAPDVAWTVLSALRQPRRVADEVAALLRAHACPATVRSPIPERPAEVRRYISTVGPARIPAQLALLGADAAALPPRTRAAFQREVKKLHAAVDAVLAARPPLAAGDLALDGRAVTAALGGTPGPHVGEALRHLLDRVLEDPGLNTASALEAELLQWWAGRPARL